MSVRRTGFTRASALGPIADFVERQGGSISRVLDEVDLPHAILETPDAPLPLPEQFRVLERAARETGDPHFGARLGREVRIEKLSAFGRWVSRAATVEGAIERSNRGLNAYLQTGTVLKLECEGHKARWSIEFLDPGFDGKYQNELLGLSYLIDVVRCKVGRRWTPELIHTTTTRDSQVSGLEQVFEANVAKGRAVPTIEFDRAVLEAGGGYRLPGAGPGLAEEPLVPADDYGAIAAVISLALLEGYPRIDWVAAKVGMTRRSLQRRLAEKGTTFSRLLDDLLRQRSVALLRTSAEPVTEIALRLGYADPAHFTRAFRRWTGTSPSAFRGA